MARAAEQYTAMHIALQHGLTGACQALHAIGAVVTARTVHQDTAMYTHGESSGCEHAPGEML